MRLSSGPEHSLLTNRPVIVTQSDPPSSLPLQQRGSPYSRVERRADDDAQAHGVMLPARPFELELEGTSLLPSVHHGEDRQ